MKKFLKIILSTIVSAMFLLSFAGCEGYEDDPYATIMAGGRFAIIEERTTSNTVYVEFYDVNTKVIYVYIKLSESGSFSPLYDSNGDLLTYKGK